MNLKLSGCSIQDEGAFAMSELLIANSFLKKIWIDFNKISGKGIISIAQALLKNYSLEFIALWGNDWTVEACEVGFILIHDNNDNNNNRHLHLL